MMNSHSGSRLVSHVPSANPQKHESVRRKLRILIQATGRRAGESFAILRSFCGILLLAGGGVPFGYRLAADGSNSVTGAGRRQLIIGRKQARKNTTSTGKIPKDTP